MSQCKSCEAPIIWAMTEKGRRIPLDEEPVRDGIRFRVGHGNVASRVGEGDQSGHRAHFATCPNANDHRKVH